MAGKVLSVEVGSYLTKICEIDYKSKKSKLYNYFIVETPQGMLEDGFLSVNQPFVNHMKSELAKRKITTKKVVFSISSSKIASREVMLPFVKENRMVDLVRTNAANYFPIDITKYQFTHNIIRLETQDKGIKQYRTMILAIPNNLLEGYNNLANALGMEVTAIDYVGNSIFQVVKTEFLEGTQMIIKVDEFSTMMMVIKDAATVFSRNIPYGISDGIITIMNSDVWGENLSYLEATEIGRKNKVLYLKTNRDDSSIPSENPEDQKILIERKNVTSSLSTLIGGIARVIDYYQASAGANPIDKFLLTGIGGDLTELTEFLGQEMGIHVETIKKLDCVIAEKDFFDNNFGEYISCIGAAIAPITFYSNVDSDSKKGKKTNSVNQLAISIGILVLGIGISAALIIIAFVPYLTAVGVNSVLTQRQQELQPIKTIYQAYLDSKTYNGKLKAWDSVTYNSNDDILTFIAELEEKMPSTFSVQSLTTDASTATLEVTVGTKEAAALVIAQIRNFENVASVKTDSITEVQSETGEIQVVLSVNVVFNTAEAVATGEAVITPETVDTTDTTGITDTIETIDTTEIVE